MKKNLIFELMITNPRESGTFTEKTKNSFKSCRAVCTKRVYEHINQWDCPTSQSRGRHDFSALQDKGKIIIGDPRSYCTKRITVNDGRNVQRNFRNETGIHRRVHPRPNQRRCMFLRSIKNCSGSLLKKSRLMKSSASKWQHVLKRKRWKGWRQLFNIFKKEERLYKYRRRS